LSYGTDGTVVLPHKTYNNMVYIIMEYVEGGILYDIVEQVGKLGEDAGRFFLK